MDRLTSILVGIDFSDSSIRAMQEALRMARWNAATTHVYHVVSAHSQAYIPTDAESKIDELLSDIDHTSVVTHAVIVGSLLDETLRLVRERSADLLAIGAFGPLGQFTGSGVGVFAAQCMRHVPCKVLAVHHSLRAAFHRILAAVDFSPTSARALEAAVRLARQEDGELHVLYVPEQDEERAEALERLESTLSHVAGDVDDLDYRCVVARSSDPGDGIIRYARKVEADLITLGTRGKSDLRYVLTGSTCERVLRGVRRSVLVTKPEAFVPPAYLL